MIQHMFSRGQLVSNGTSEVERYRKDRWLLTYRSCIGYDVAELLVSEVEGHSVILEIWQTYLCQAKNHRHLHSNLISFASGNQIKLTILMTSSTVLSK